MMVMDFSLPTSPKQTKMTEDSFPNEYFLTYFLRV